MISLTKPQVFHQSSKALAAAAARMRVGIVELEARALQRFDVVDDRAAKEFHAFLVDMHAHAFLFKYYIVIARRLLEIHVVRISGASACDDAHTQRIAVLALLLHNLQDFLRGEIA